MPTNKPRLQFTIKGLDCAEEVTVLKREVGPAVGGEDRLGFDILNGRMTVTGAGVTADQVCAAVARTGMTAELWVEGEPPARETDYWERNQRAILTATCGAFLLAGLASHAAIAGFREAFTEDSTAWPPVVAVACYLLSIVAGVWTVLPKAWVAAKHLAPDMNLLMVVAVCGAVAINQWAEAATVAFLFSLSIALEAWSVGRARRAVAALMNLSPPTARLVLTDGREESVAPDKVPVGGKFRVRPGDRVPLDGRVVEGSGGVDQSPITGESVPVPKNVGDEVYAGTINGDGLLTVESTRPASDTTLARITRMVGEAQSRRSPSEQWVETFARYYTPAVMVLALAVLALPPLAFAEPWGAVALPLARAACHRLPVRPGNLDAREHRRLTFRRGP